LTASGRLTDEFDAELASPAFTADPYPTFRRLRVQDPVHWSPAWGMWLVTRYADVARIKRDPGRFSNAGRVAARLAVLDPGQQAALAPFRAHFASGVIDSDPPEHTRLRSMIVRAFTPQAVESLRTRIGRLVDELIRPHLAVGRIDVVRDFAYPLPATVISELLGLPEEDRERFKHWSDVISRFYGSHGEERWAAAQAGQEAVLEAREWIGALASDRRRSPAPDLLTALVQAEDGGGLSEEQLLATCVTLMIAGHETTTSFISTGIHSLLCYPDQLAVFRYRPELHRIALEELVRYESPAQKNARVVMEDTEIGGRVLRAGDLVMLLLGAANHDPEIFAEPDRVVLERPENRHLAFGIGIHFCAGAGLARLETSVALPALAGLPRLRFSEAPPRWQENTNLRSLDSLILEFDATTTVAR
jgi:cytochrome P450